MSYLGLLDRFQIQMRNWEELTGKVNTVRFVDALIVQLELDKQSYFDRWIMKMWFFSIPSCDFKKSDSAGGVYVKPSIAKTGKFRNEHVRKKVSTDKNAIKNQNRRRYY